MLLKVASYIKKNTIIFLYEDGLHVVPEEIDFGTLISVTETKLIFLSILNSLNYSIKIIDIQNKFQDSFDSQLYIETFSNNIIPPRTVLYLYI